MWLLAVVFIIFGLFLPTVLAVIAAAVLIELRRYTLALIAFAALAFANLYWLRLPVFKIDVFSRSADKPTLFLVFIMALMVGALVAWPLLRYRLIPDEVFKRFAVHIKATP